MFNTSILVFSCVLSILFCMFLRSNGQNQGHHSDKDNIRLYHYPNPLNTSERYEVTKSNNAKLNRNRRAKLIVHGAGGHCMKDDVPFRIIEAYLRAKASNREDYNIMCLDYGPLAQLGPVPGDPIPSIRKRYEYVCDTVSDKVVDLILDLEANGYISNFNQVHLIGHSLGGQVSGYIGRKVLEQTGQSLGRITGLDVANIFFFYSNEVNLQNQLDLSDADFVDIIHTSPIGLKGNYGHIDVYPDGGVHQNSCLTKGPVSNVTELITGGCSHVIVGKYWENSIDNPNITACKDQSWENFLKKKSDGYNNCSQEHQIIFGEYVSTKARGKYFLEYPLIKP